MTTHSVAPVGKWGVTPLLSAARLLITAMCAVGAVTASFIFISTLGTLTGWPGRSALLLPLSVDALAAAAWLTYWSGEGDARRFAGRVGAGATVASMAGNGLSHLLVAGWGGWAWALLVALVGSVPAVSLALVVRLSVSNVSRPAQDVNSSVVNSSGVGADGPGSATAPDSGGEEIGGAADATPEDAPPAEATGRGRPRVTRTGDPNDVLLARLPAELLARPTASGIRKHLGVGTGRAAELRDLIAAGHGVEHVNGRAVDR